MPSIVLTSLSPLFPLYASLYSFSRQSNCKKTDSQIIYLFTKILNISVYSHQRYIIYDI